MRLIPQALIPALALAMMLSCTPEAVKYDLPSAAAKERPTWVGTQKAARDTIFIVVHIPRAEGALNTQVQDAQSALHQILVEELDTIIREYWEQKGFQLSEDEQFEELRQLPLTLESVMRHVTVTDGWEGDNDRSYLCALDYEDITEELMQDLDIQDISFRSYLKRQMDSLSRKYR